MIPTVKKDKLPSSLAYPVRAQRVSDALSSIPQIAHLELWFIRNDYGQSEVDGKHLVIAARYKKSNMGISASYLGDELGIYGPTWDVWVYAVPKAINAPVRSALHDHGFRMVRDWYSKPRSDLWLTTSHECRLWYSPAEERLVATFTDT